MTYFTVLWLRAVHHMQENNYQLIFFLLESGIWFIENFLDKKGGGPYVQNFLEFNDCNSRLYWKLDFLDLHSSDQFQNKLVHPPNFIVLTSSLESVQDLNFKLGIQTTLDSWTKVSPMFINFGFIKRLYFWYFW